MTPPRAVAIQALVTVAALGAVIVWALRQPRPELPTDPDTLAVLAGATAVYAAATLGRGERWSRLLELSDVRSSRPEAYGLTVVGYAANNTLPARAGDLLRVLLLAPRVGASRRVVLGSVVAERLLDVLALSLLVAVAGAALAGRASVPLGPALVLLGVAVCAAVAGAILVFAPGRFALLRRVRTFLEPVAAAPRALLGASGLALLALSVAVWLAEAGVYIVVGHAASIELGLAAALYVVAVTNLFSLLPAGPGYAGTFDAAVILALQSLGFAGEEALTFLLLVRFVLFVPITLVGFSLFLRLGGWGRYREARASF